MTLFEEAIGLLTEQMGRDVQVALATCLCDEPTVRTVDGYFKDDAIYVLTHLASRKMRDILQNPRVAVCHNLMQGTGIGENLGNPREEKNNELTPELKQVFCFFYDRHVNEEDPGTCILRINLKRAAVFGSDCRYTLDFDRKTAEKFSFHNDIVAS